MVTGRLDPSLLRDAIVRATRRYAKRQETWFRHQLRYRLSAVGYQPEEVWTLDATRSPASLAGEVLDRWRVVSGR
jgi:tRNA A37 N6-isopentenylltransferase MiaA